MKIKMIPAMSSDGTGASGIHRVIEAYHKYLPNFGVEFVDEDYDLLVTHAGAQGIPPDVAILHGLYWTGDYKADSWEFAQNASIIKAIRGALEITVPSDWVAECFRRDMRINPTIIPHGIELKDWEHDFKNEGYVLWNKNRVGDVCDPRPMTELAKKFKNVPFVATFSSEKPENIKLTGVISHQDMKPIIQKAAVYLSTTQETFGVGVLEAMASGVPVLGFRHGGNCDLIRHGTTGYLAENFEDLCEGLNFCLENRKALGGNGREAAKEYAWNKGVEKLHKVFVRALKKKHEPDTVAVIIPAYNYSDKVELALQSALNQTVPADEIIVVDDGSKDNGKTAEIIAKYEKVKYIRQDNSGVAIARNRGIRESKANLIVCLDADDVLNKDFIRACKPAFADRSLGIAYTGITLFGPNGETKVSEWPGPFDFEKQLKRQNQIPTCCMFRREMWERLGGYRQRYAPMGAGSEDAEFWLRAGAHGWNAKKVTDAGLFYYSYLTGNVSGNRKYREVDWTEYHPWTRDKTHPFVSVAQSLKQSHPVRSYEKPIISVIIPVGPGHEHILLDALDSMEAQTVRGWEVIVAWDSPNKKMQEFYIRAYPYVKIIDTGCRGAGFARNRGVEASKAPFLFFLDADDYLKPNALFVHLDEWRVEKAIIYSDYLGKAAVSDPDKLDPGLKARIVTRDKETGITVMRYKAFDYDCERAQRQPEGQKPYIWCNVSVLIPRAWHDSVGGFDETMKSWEDVDYHWRLARKGYCYRRVESDLLVYRFNTGFRRESGRQDYDNLLSYLRKKYKEAKTEMCGSCGKNKRRTVIASPPTSIKSGNTSNAPAGDPEFIRVRYESPMRGSHSVIGNATKIKYGQRSGGEIFLVHKKDIEVNPELYTPMEGSLDIPFPEPKKIAPPAPVVEPTMPKVQETKPKRRGRPKKVQNL